MSLADRPPTPPLIPPPCASGLVATVMLTTPPLEKQIHQGANCSATAARTGQRAADPFPYAGLLWR